MLIFHLICRIAISICFLGALFSLLMLFRNNWVYNKRTEILNRQTNLSDLNNEYDRLPSYDQMMWRFWIWDIEKFIKKS